MPSALRLSGFSSIFIITWDEHGGFYDHATPPAAVAPGDTSPSTGHNKYGFTFEQYGPRVPAVVISPWIPKNIVDHRLYDHSSIPATIEKLFGLDPMTARDRGGANYDGFLCSLSMPLGKTRPPHCRLQPPPRQPQCPQWPCHPPPAMRPTSLRRAAATGVNDGKPAPPSLSPPCGRIWNSPPPGDSVTASSRQ